MGSSIAPALSTADYALIALAFVLIVLVDSCKLDCRSAEALAITLPQGRAKVILEYAGCED